VNPVQDRVADGGVIWTSRIQNDHVYMRALETVMCLPSSSIEQVIDRILGAVQRMHGCDLDTLTN
jgi:hypothetical protein